jgi:hypothetical protein
LQAPATKLQTGSMLEKQKVVENWVRQENRVYLSKTYGYIHCPDTLGVG